MSPKNKGKFGKGKSDIEETDEFVSGVNKFFDQVKPYAKRIGVTAGVVLVGFLAFVVWQWFDDRSEQEATTLFAESVDVMRQQVQLPSDLPDDPDKPKPEDLPPGDRPPPTHASTKAQAEAALPLLEKLSGTSGTAAATHGKLLEARVLLDLGKPDEALALYRSYASDAPSEVVRTVAREGVGYALEARAMASDDAAAREAGLREAIEAFRQVQPEEKGLRWHYALYHEARLTATLDDKARAGELYRKILATEPPAAVEDSVNARLAMLDLASAPPAPAGDGDGADGEPAKGDDGAAPVQ